MHMTADFFNFVRELFGAETVNWLGFDYVKRALIIMMLWTSGGGALTIIAAIKGIPDDLYEAADIEGVGPVSKTFKITLPLVSNMIYMHITTSIIGTLQLFAQPVLLAGASGEGLTSVPIRPVYTYLVHVYQQIFVNMRFGYGMAMVWSNFCNNYDNNVCA
ncbi:MAG: ABC transporter permease subunit [Clostridiales bacterium]|nr:MAG: ABC transporter permease subunit [Clostridiales bacterium]